MFNVFRIIPFLSLVIILSACEYESVQNSSDCTLNAISLSIVEVNNTSCGLAEGEITVAAQGGNGEYEYSFNEGNFVSSTVFSNLGAGTYTIVARDISSLCESEPKTQEVANINGLQITVQKTDTECGSNSGEITVVPENGVEPIRYKINDTEFQSDPIFSALSSGKYTISAVDAAGCETSIENVSITSGTSLTDDIQPIIMTNCAVSGCHNGNISPNLSTKQGIINNSDRIESETAAGTMPPVGRQDLTREQIDLIACWVNEGFLNN